MKLLLSIHQFDLQAFTWCMRRKQRQFITQVSRGLSCTADGPLYLLIVLALWLWHPVFTTAWVGAVFMAFVIERSLYLVLKNSFRRNRPQEAIVGFHSFIRPSDQFSFPSGHTSCAFLFAVILAHVFPALITVLMIWAASIGFARVFLGVHFPTDTLMGALMGSTIASLVLGVMVL
ncbi:MAG: phosphatase PAP2 family protein [Natronospirillum sp.]